MAGFVLGILEQQNGYCVPDHGEKVKRLASMVDQRYLAKICISINRPLYCRFVNDITKNRQSLGQYSGELMAGRLPSADWTENSG